ncbi:MAG TPA: signal peptidase I [Sphingomicrobium sp.]|nr:signal peptidase I [Sphingomicrobium sp.]
MAFPSFRRAHYADPSPDKARETPASLVRSLLIIAALAWALRSLIVAPFSIPSGSMLPNMMIGDYLFVSKWPYGYSRASFPLGIPSFDGRVMGSTARRGDVVVFVGPAGVDVIKRVIGLPGDIIAVQGGQLILNSRPVPRQRVEDFLLPLSPNSPCRVVPPAVAMTRPTPDGSPACVYPAYRETLPGGRSFTVIDQAEASIADNMAPTAVPQGHLFLMGDNRDDSLDSRYSIESGGMGFVPIDRVIGRAEFIFWSTDGSSSWINPVSWFSALRTERLGSDFRP